MAKFPYINQRKEPKRLEELSRSQQEDLVFDLINAFALAKDPLSAAILLQDLLTAAEIKNLSKRLRIAKLLLEGKKQEEIIEDLSCSFGTISKVKAWLEESGEGFKQIVKKLPKRRQRYEIRKGVLGHYALPEVFLKAFFNALETSERRRVENFLASAEKKDEVFKGIQKVIDEAFREKHRQSSK